MIWMILSTASAATAAGMVGPLQTPSKTAGGLNTAIAYQYVQDVYEASSAYVVRQQQVYTHAAYGRSDIWEVFGRIGISDFKISDAFQSQNAYSLTSKSDFEDNCKFFGSIGAKAFYPVTGWLGIGVFVQGTYYVSPYRDAVTGVVNGVPFEADLKIKNLWDLRGGFGLQATLPGNIRVYGGPYAYRSEADAVLSQNIAGIEFGKQETRLMNQSEAGGFFGVDLPLLKGFRLNVEGQCARRLSLGAAMTYTY